MLSDQNEEPQAIYIPYDLTWFHENQVDENLSVDGYHELEHIGQVSDLILTLSDR